MKDRKETTGTKGTMGFVQHRTKNGSVCTRTHHGCGVRGYGYGLGKSYLQYTHAEP